MTPSGGRTSEQGRRGVTSSTHTEGSGFIQVSPSHPPLPSTPAALFPCHLPVIEDSLSCGSATKLNASLPGLFGPTLAFCSPPPSPTSAVNFQCQLLLLSPQCLCCACQTCASVCVHSSPGPACPPYSCITLAALISAYRDQTGKHRRDGRKKDSSFGLNSAHLIGLRSSHPGTCCSP